MTENAPRSADIAALAKAAWYAEGDDGSPSETWWDCTRDTWTDGFEVGYRAALAAHKRRGAAVSGGLLRRVVCKRIGHTRDVRSPWWERRCRRCGSRIPQSRPLDPRQNGRRPVARFDGSRATDQACPDCGHHLSLHDADGCGISTCDCRHSPPKDADGT